eukprot:3631572-Rhodomonas_salina.3
MAGAVALPHKDYLNAGSDVEIDDMEEADSSKLKEAWFSEESLQNIWGFKDPETERLFRSVPTRTRCEMPGADKAYGAIRKSFNSSILARHRGCGLLRLYVFLG